MISVVSCGVNLDLELGGLCAFSRVSPGVCNDELSMKDETCLQPITFTTD